MNKTDWELRLEGDREVLTRLETPIVLWLLDRWFRVPDVVFDRIEWWFPGTSAITRIPCVLYSRWVPELIVRQSTTEYDFGGPPRFTVPAGRPYHPGSI